LLLAAGFGVWLTGVLGLSLVGTLLIGTLFVAAAAGSLTSIPRPRAPAPALAALSVSTAFVYGWTMVAKLEGPWLDGSALQRIMSGRRADLALQLGLDGPGFDALLEQVAPSVAVLQAVIALGLVLAPIADRSRLGIGLRSIAAAGALSFHVGAELLGLDIGWFSYYMLLVTVALLFPTTWVETAWAGVLLPWKRLQVRVAELKLERPARLIGVAVSAIWLVWCGVTIDLPGAVVATACLAASLTVAAGVEAYLESRTSPVAGRIGSGSLALSLALAGAAFVGSVSASEARYDFYRLLGGAHYRMEAWEEALVAYEKANAYAPPDQNRDRQEQEARREAARRR
jgi:hypothetical protein